MNTVALNMSVLDQLQLKEINKRTKQTYNKNYPYLVYEHGEYFDAQSWLVALRSYKILQYNEFINHINKQLRHEQRTIIKRS